MSDIRTTQEVLGDFVGGLLSLGERGVDALVIARALARALIRKGILTEAELLAIMREIVASEVEKNKDAPFVMAVYKEILDRFDEDSPPKSE
jgi:hypothetical protein